MSAISEILKKYRSELLEDWLSEMTGAIRRSDLMGTDELRQQAVHFLDLLQLGANASTDGDLSGPAWQDMRELLIDISRSHAAQGFTASETARFVLSFKKPLFARLRRELKDADGLASQTWEANNMLDNIGLYTTEVFLKSREAIIQRQQQDMLELSTPVVKLWEGILALPLIGTLDSARTQIVMESLLQQIVNTGSRVAIIDITGVPTVDTLVAQHLLKTVTAARLMGADCIISGIRPQIAQTIVHLGVGLGDVITKATLADAFVVALQRTGSTISKTQR